MLCAKCENDIAKHEDYVAKLCRRIAADTTPPYQVITFDTYDYRAIKLFAVSVLWKAAVSGLRMYDNIQLGPHEARMHEMLLHGDPGDPREYAILITKLSGSELARTTMMPPTPITWDDMPAYRMLSMGIEWTITATERFAMPVIPQAQAIYVGMHEKLLVPVMPRDDETIARTIYAQIPEEQHERAVKVAERMMSKATM